MEVFEKKQVTLFGTKTNQTVSSAGQLLGRCPHGWTLISLTWDGVCDRWIAVCQGPTNTKP